MHANELRNEEIKIWFFAFKLIRFQTTFKIEKKNKKEIIKLKQ